MSAAPLQYGFEYEVRLAVSIPFAWAQLLKLAAENHYDYKCRESGKQGVVNALYNTAIARTDEDGDWLGGNHPVSWPDLDRVMKIAEQLHHHTKDHELIFAINKWLHETMDAISAQRALCMKLPGSAEAA